MSSSARIDELRKKFDENPRRFFAPLANEYRKAGDFEQAVFICQEYLPQQPGHMSGHIVYGQTLFDMGRDEEARAVFETALTLDPENLIALKHLGDIARQAGDFEGSRSWYQRVLEADPRNEEIMQILEGMGGVDGSSTAHLREAVSEPSASSQAESGSYETAFDNSAEPIEHVDEPSESSLDAAATTESDIEPLVLEQSVGAELPAAEPELVAVVETFASSAVEAASEPDSHELLDLDDFSIGGSDAPTESPVEPEPEPTAAAGSLDFHPFGEEPASAESAPESTPEPPIDLATDVILGLPDDTPEPPPLPVEPALAELPVEPTAEAGEDLTRAIDQLEGLETFSMDVSAEIPSGASEEVQPIVAPDTFATETMAELYAQQGHLESALEIYDQLLERSPEDAELHRRADALKRQLLGPPAAEAIDSTNHTEDATAAHELPGEVEQSDVAPAAVAGPTIREFFRAILEDRRDDEIAATSVPNDFTEPPTDDAIVAESEGSIDILFSDSPTAADDLSAAMSLAEAFGGENEGDDAALHGTPAHPATDELSLDHVFRTATPAKGSGAAGAFSLDEFFSGNAPDPTAPETLAESSPPRSTDDIAQFNAWLNGLKKS